MPVILAPADFGRWLDPEAAKGEHLQALLRPYPAEVMTAYPVDSRVNSPKHNDPSCVAPLAARVRRTTHPSSLPLSRCTVSPGAFS